MTEEFDLRRRLFAEGAGTVLLAATVIGSGIMGERLAQGNAAVALLGNTLATGAALVALIMVFGPVSGAHFNPVVSLSFALQSKLKWRDFGAYATVQTVAGVAGTVLAHGMFGLPLLQTSTHLRHGMGIWTGEIVASCGLLLVILGCLRTRPHAVPAAVAAFIVAGYWFTSSTSFANPAMTIARAFTDTFAGIRPADVPYFIFAQITGALLATGASRWLWHVRAA